MNLGEKAPEQTELPLPEPEAWAMTVIQDGFPDITMYFRDKRNEELERLNWLYDGCVGVEAFIVPVVKRF